MWKTVLKRQKHNGDSTAYEHCELSVNGDGLSGVSRSKKSMRY
ncbi:MAG: hypothetical protein Q4P16_06545 [Spirochaetales bacterium]|nr:hypothetical protein [Spirochaetales bacterium]